MKTKRAIEFSEVARQESGEDSYPELHSEDGSRSGQHCMQRNHWWLIDGCIPYGNLLKWLMPFRNMKFGEFGEDFLGSAVHL